MLPRFTRDIGVTDDLRMGTLLHSGSPAIGVLFPFSGVLDWHALDAGWTGSPALLRLLDERVRTETSRTGFNERPARQEPARRNDTESVGDSTPPRVADTLREIRATQSEVITLSEAARAETPQLTIFGRGRRPNTTGGQRRSQKRAAESNPGGSSNRDLRPSSDATTPVRDIIQTRLLGSRTDWSIVHRHERTPDAAAGSLDEFPPRRPQISASDTADPSPVQPDSELGQDDHSVSTEQRTGRDQSDHTPNTRSRAAGPPMTPIPAPSREMPSSPASGPVSPSSSTEDRQTGASSAPDSPPAMEVAGVLTTNGAVAAGEQATSGPSAGLAPAADTPATAPEKPREKDVPPVNQPAKPTPTPMETLFADTSQLNRLVDRLYLELERKVRFERERRGG